MASTLAASCSTDTTDSHPAKETATPHLSQLAIPDMRMWPRFEPSVFDYVVECGSSAVVHPRATAPSRFAVSAPSSQTIRPGGRLVLSVADRQGVLEPVEYSLRCLPRDFPDITAHGRGSSYVFVSLPARSSDASFEALLSPSGVPVWYRRVAGSPPLVLPVSTTPLRFLEMTVPDREFGPFSVIGARNVVLRDENGDALREWKLPTDAAIDHHDIALLENGNLLAIAYERSNPPPGMDSAPFALAHPVFGQTCANGPFDPASDHFMDSRVLEITPSGQVARTLSLGEKLGATGISFPVRFNTPGSSGRCAFDAYHANALDVLDDHLLVTGLAMDGAALFDLETLDLRARIGGRPGERSLALEGDPLGGPARPHDGRLSYGPTGTLRVSFFDNRIGFPANASRFVSFIVDLKERTATLSSSSTSSCEALPCTSSWGGSARLTASGGVLLGLGSRSTPALEEYDAAGHVVLSIAMPASYRALPVPTPGDIPSLRSASDDVPDAPLSGSCNRDYFGVCT